MADQVDARYARQTRLEELGDEGQRRLAQSSVLIVGCGALGSVVASSLARAGVGRIRIVDRDIVELHNLHRQALFDESDATQRLPKAEAAARHLRRINSTVTIEAMVFDVTPRTMEPLLQDIDLVLDGSDNLETRYLLNDACLKHHVPWVYGGVVATAGMALVVAPDGGPCLRCLFPDPPPPGSLPTCETVGILGTVPTVIGAIQSTEALKWLTGQPTSRDLLYVDLWHATWERIRVRRDDHCPACVYRRFDFLEARTTSWVTSLCGRDAIQITPGEETRLSLDCLSQALAGVVRATYNGFVLHLEVEGCELLLFPDGRAIVRGTSDEGMARSLYARYVGH
jgi:adenylyltransferase/sulfurtransferase